MKWIRKLIHSKCIEDYEYLRIEGKAALRDRDIMQNGSMNLINQIQEQHKEINQLQKQIKELKERPWSNSQ